MVGAMLSRVLSRTKMLSSISLQPDFSEKEKHSYQQSQIIDTRQCSDYVVEQGSNTTAVKMSTTCHELEVKNVSRNHANAVPSLRKDSYTSIKEDPEHTQSFTTRLLQHEHDQMQDARFPKQRALDELDESALCTDLIDGLEIDYPDNESTVAAGESRNAMTLPSSADLSPPNLDTLPDEILDIIFSLLTTKPIFNCFLKPPVDLFNLSLASKAVHAAAQRVLYRHVKISQSKAFFKLHNTLNATEDHVGESVQCLDFSHYTNMGFGRAQSTKNMIPYLTPITLKSCLNKTTKLKAFLVHEHVDSELDTEILTKLLNLRTLRALDLCACFSSVFVQAFTRTCMQLSWKSKLSLERLSLHECATLPTSVFARLLSRLPRLTHLDVAHTKIDDMALMYIPNSAQITHLNLERCTQITGSGVVEFVTKHKAVKDTMVYLNLQADASRYRLLSEDDVSELLPALPSTLRSLNLGGAKINKSHTDCLRRLATHVEELGLKGADLCLSVDILHILGLDKTRDTETVKHSLRYLDLTDVNSVTQFSIMYAPVSILPVDTLPLEVIELSESVRKEIGKHNKKVKDPEWRLNELGRRGWYVRQKHNLPLCLVDYDDGYRSWKMGARWWGMRKIPVFEQETGGMYGYFMFKRA